jgi:hypothetical protein
MRHFKRITSEIRQITGSLLLTVTIEYDTEWGFSKLTRTVSCSTLSQCHQFIENLIIRHNIEGAD